MKLLLTGPTGFSATALQKELNDHIVILTLRGDEIESSPRFFRKNISSTENFSDCLSNIDVVIHTAARVHQINNLVEDPQKEFMETNCFGALNLARQATLNSSEEIDGVYHFCGDSACSWFEFAKEIFNRLNMYDQISIPTIKAITTEEYLTPAKRPKFSVLDNQKIQEKFDIFSSDWKVGIESVIKKNGNVSYI